MNGFKKWLSSTKFQIAFIAIGLIYVAMEIFDADPADAIGAIRDVAIGYFGARVAEPIVEFMTKKLSKKKTEDEVEFEIPIR